MITQIRASILHLLHIPLSYKILLANCSLTTVLALGGASVAIRYVQAEPSNPHIELIVLLVAMGMVISFAVDFAVLRLVLTPLKNLEIAMHDTAQGRQHPVARNLISDENLDQMAAALSAIQNTLENNDRRLRLMSQQLVYAQEAERKRIAIELHDKTAQTLTSVLLYLKLLEKSCTPEEAQRLQNLRKLITHALSEIRQLAVELHPRVLDDWGLEAALAQQVDELNADGSKQVTLQIVGGSLERLPRELEFTFYHVAQEALNNMFHHSKARHSSVSLVRQVDCLSLEIQDDGIGFSPSVMRVESARGLGLSSIRQRLNLVNGELTIDSHPGCGTRLCARAPIPHDLASQQFLGSNQKQVRSRADAVT